MINEKMKILKMLEEGSITSAEAARLLDSIAGGAPVSSAPAHQGTSQAYPSNLTAPAPTPGYGTGHSAPAPAPGYGTGYSAPASAHGYVTGHPAPGTVPGYAKGHSAPGYGPGHPASGYGYSGSASNDSGKRRTETGGRSGESFADDLSRKFETFLKDFEPRLQRFTEVVVEKTSSAADALSKTFSPPPPKPYEPERSYQGYASSARSGPTAPPSRPAAGPAQPSAGSSSSATPARGRNERSFEIKVTENGSELIIGGLNGQVLLKGYNGDKISAKVNYTAKRGNPHMELVTLGKKYYLNYDENEYDTVSIDAYIPEAMFSDIRVSTNNGGLIISTVRTVNAKFDNMNGSIDISGFAAKDFAAETNNGNVKLTAIRAERAVIENFNGMINVTDIDISQLKTLTANGGIAMQISKFESFSEYMWVVESNNGKVNMIMPSSVDTGYYLKAAAALSDVKIGLTGLSFISNSKSFAEAQSVNYDQADKKIRLLLETSNAPLVVN